MKPPFEVRPLNPRLRDEGFGVWNTIINCWEQSGALSATEAEKLAGDLSDTEDELEKVPSHRNDLGDWCPGSGERTGDGTCPQYCHEADVLAGFDAGDRELPGSTDLPAELYKESGGVKYAVHPGWDYPELEDAP